jgi:quercetin dioxygenase-like cupin family protein
MSNSSADNGGESKMWVTDASNVKPLNLDGVQVGGVDLKGEVDLRVLVTGANIQIVQLSLAKGFYHPPHNHPEHESIGYVITGELEMGIGEEEHVLGPGHAWHHGIGVIHWTRAREDTLAIEIHSPRRPEFSA